MIFRFFLALFIASALASPSFASNEDKPMCKKLEALYLELGKRSGQIPTQAEIDEAVYGENPSDADCAAMLSLFPVKE